MLYFLYYNTILLIFFFEIDKIENESKEKIFKFSFFFSIFVES